MKTPSSLFKIFLTLSCGFISFNLNAQQFDLKPESMQLFSKRSTEEYANTLEQILNQIDQTKKASQLAPADQKKLLEIETHFKNVCADRDFEDEVLLKSDQNGALQVIYTCFEGYEAQESQSFIFEFDSTQKLAGFSELSVSKENLSGQKNKGLKLILKEAVAILASAALTHQLSAKVFFAGEKDKSKHGTLSSLLASVITASSHYFFKVSPKKAAFIGFSACGLIGAAKEYYDSKHRDRHTPDVRDLKADLLGCTLGSVGIVYAIEFE